MPERWSRSRNRIYFYQPDTKQSVWERPQGDVTIAPLFQNDAPDGATIRASHLLVKHAQSRRPSSWKEANITRSKDEARRMIDAYRERIVSGETDLATLARTESDCNSAARGGDLGQFGKGQMQASFEAAAFALAVGELSGPVESDSGIHLILRTE
ncbi:peptidyl-prolyl cis-trans isomerase Pin1 [Polyrhizophydium stewartii]|uniref:Peptidyl-prolyl cis-trans isomerase n=1 Tax=Polyrhizophydium stewartii TaxID=2732419 RepID=A0ABR4N8N6_9FUNG|nr:Peptidyl-prolyl cis-trans isomerase NIMA-interacting protein 1 [Polyrhizophydium stewartii]